MRTEFERELRWRFPGKNNTGLRAKIRKAASRQDYDEPMDPVHRVRAIVHSVAFTAQGQASLEVLAVILQEGVGG